ncbi:hypothetical protein FA95DRAFT_1584438 [Auriscalpium vulgare]|uniref:Uncharacterized protein n=1 Tax=Auriscalpium vulgare TaxID=40419 RepID=A0ACB8RFQ6_9AGAM|nr:hypothetical protein FA95DRAFT_1584438 [Auriscalpium vulgare]
MKLKRINVLGLQETHLIPNHLASVHATYPRLLVFNSPDPDSAGATAGVAFAINKAITRTDNTRFIELVPGQAALLVLNWRETEATTILNIYAPNGAGEHPAFWQAVQDALQAHGITTKDLFGDFNLVEDEIDHTPTRSDRPAASKARTVYEWDQVIGCVPSDHDMISVRYAPVNATATGPGRWTMPLHLLTNTDFLSEIKDAGRKLESDITDAANSRTPTHNP